MLVIMSLLEMYLVSSSLIFSTCRSVGSVRSHEGIPVINSQSTSFPHEPLRPLQSTSSFFGASISASREIGRAYLSRVDPLTGEGVVVRSHVGGVVDVVVIRVASG